MRRLWWLAASELFVRVASQTSTIVDVDGLPINISGLPPCAQSCLANSTGAANGCSITDIHCLCSSITYINQLSCCLERQCSPADQEAALKFDILLCDQHNVSIPNFIGCSPLESSSGLYSPAAGTQLSSFISVVASAVAVSVSTITAVAPAYTTTDGGPTATFDGSVLLTGTCASPTIVTYIPTGSNAGALTGVPWLGCQGRNGDCCPFDPASAGPLTSCPLDYFTTALGCCPNGWSMYSTALYNGQTPCVTSASVPLTAPILTTITAAGSTPSMLTTDIFALHYTLAPPVTRLSSGTIGGIAVGTALASVLLGTLSFILRRRHQQRALLRRNASIVRSRVSGTTATEDTATPTTPYSKYSTLLGAASAPPSPRRELPSREASGAHWIAGVVPGAGCPRSPAVEMPASSFMHEHHPVFQSGTLPRMMDAASGFYSPPGPGTPAAVSVTSPGGTSETEIYRAPFASVERISGTYSRGTRSP